MALDPAIVRAWAREQGIPVGDRGRLRRELFTAYEASTTSVTRIVRSSPRPGAGAGAYTIGARRA